jgi:D-sedoheptulose 7-phosphate isomerase
VIEVTTNQVRALISPLIDRVLVFYQRRVRARAPTAFDVRRHVSDKPGARQVNAVSLRRVQHEERLRLPAFAAVFGAVHAVQKLTDRRSMEKFDDPAVRRLECCVRRLPLRDIRLIRDDEEEPAIRGGPAERLSHARPERDLVSVARRLPFTRIGVENEIVDDPVAIKKKGFSHQNRGPRVTAPITMKMRNLRYSGRNMSFAEEYIAETIDIVRRIDTAAIDRLAEGLAAARKRGGRLFILGVGGSAGHASHAVNDFRKICAFEAYTPTDNVSELTARVNDEGWETSFIEWLKISRVSERDAVLVFSVGGGNAEKNVSVNLIRAMDEAKKRGASIYGIVGKDGGYTKKVADECVVIPTASADRITPHTEGLCAVVWHMLVSHPALKVVQTKWESVGR